MGAADEVATLSRLGGSIREDLGRLEGAVGKMSLAARGELGAILTSPESASGELSAARTSYLEAQATRIASLRTWLSETTAIGVAILPLVDTASFDLVIGGEEVTESTASLISGLVGTDFAQAQAYGDAGEPRPKLLRPTLPC